MIRHALLAALLVACSGTLDAGSDHSHGLLPVDERNPVIVSNDGPFDNWQGEYALLLANSTGPALVGIVVGDSTAWPDINANIAGWTNLVTAARTSGMRNVPDPIASVGPPLVRPADGNIDSTAPNRSAGAAFILDVSRQRALPYRPLVIATGSRLTDVADAYLLDHTLPERVVVVSSLGTTSSTGGVMGVPNGEMDPWADTVVVQKFRYVQVSAYYDQTTDVPAARFSELPANAFGAWIMSKQPSILNLDVASDQVGVVAMGVHDFALDVARVAQDGTAASSLGDLPSLAPNVTGPAWLVTGSSGPAATSRFWQLLADPTVFGH